MLLFFFLIFGASAVSSYGMELPITIPERAGYDCPFGKQYFSTTPKEMVVKHLLSIQTYVPELANGNTLLHLAATITEIPDLLQDLVEKKPELAECFHVKNAAGQTPLDVQIRSREMAHRPTLKLYESNSESEDATKPKRAAKRFTLDQLQAIAEKKHKTTMATITPFAVVDKATLSSAASKIERVAAPVTPGKTLSERERLNLLALLERAGGQNNAYKATGLHMAARIANFPELMGLLLQKPWMQDFIQARDYQGFTPLARAVEAKNNAAIQALLNAGANPVDLEQLDQGPN